MTYQMLDILSEFIMSSSYILLKTDKEEGNSQVVIWEGLYLNSVRFNTGKPLKKVGQEMK